MIVIAIIGILAAIALPKYQQYVKKAKYTEVISAAEGVKPLVVACYMDTEDLTKCKDGAHGTGWTIDTGSEEGSTSYESKYVKSISVTGGVITVTPQDKEGIVEDDTFILTPKPNDNSKTIEWSTSGGCTSKGLC